MRRTALLTAILATALAHGAQAATWPRTMAALGDSLTVGQGAGSGGSWSTGTNPAVSSHLERLDAVAPGVRAFTYAQAGKKVSALAQQAQQAVAVGADYVTILIGTNDVCGSTLTSEATFRTQFSTALDTLSSGLPAARVFVASIPNWAQLAAVYGSDAKAVSTWKADGRCPGFLPSPSAAARDRLTALNGVLDDVCAAHAGCIYDGGATYAHAFTKGDYSTSDYFHLSTAGQAALAQLTFGLAFSDTPPPPPPPPPPPRPCGLADAFEGSLSTPAATAIAPASGSYATTAKGHHVACLQGPSGTNFDLFLERLEKGAWKTVSSSKGKTSTEKVDYKGKPGTYRWRIASRAGAGAFTLGLGHPS